MAFPISAAVRTAANLLSQAAPLVTSAAQVAGGLAAIHTAVSGGAAPGSPPAAPPPPRQFKECARSRMLRSQYREGQAAKGAGAGAAKAGKPLDPVAAELKHMFDQAQARAESTLKTAKSVG